MEETELEEGEAFFDDNDASIDIDPDTAFSYIDERLQNVLGHFQKDFEGGVSAEILGPKYGGYGSFLPAQKQFRTVHSHMKTPHRALNSNKPHSPDNLHLESALENSVIPSEPVLAVRPVIESVNKHSSSLPVLSGETCLLKNETFKINSGNPTEQRSLKVRIKVGSNKSARKNDAIYSGLGLLSPSSSAGNNPEDSDKLPIESHDAPVNSPSNILREMTSSFVPGNRLLSPLNENLLCLTVTERILESKYRPPIMCGKDDSSSVLGDEKLMEGKDASSRDKSEILEGIKYNKSTGNVGDRAPFSSDVRHSTAGMSNAAVTKSAENQATKKDIPVKKRAMKKDWLNDQLFGPDFICKESEQEDVNCSSMEHDEETKAMVSTKKLSLDLSGSDGIKSNKIRSVCKPDVPKLETDPGEKKVGPKVPLGDGKLPLERKNKIMGTQSSGFSISKLVKENSRSGLSGATKNMKNTQKGIVKVRDTCKNIPDTMVEDQNNRTKPLETPDIGPNHYELGAIKGKNIPRNGVSTEAIVPSLIEVAPAAPPDNWVACDRCEKWRLLPVGIETKDLPDKWMCSMSTWLPGMNFCDINEDETTRVVQEMNLHLTSLNQNSLQGSGAVSGLNTANIRHSDHSNSNVNLEVMVNGSKKNKSRPEGSSSSLIHTSHSSMDSQQHRQKRKCSSEANQQVLEKHVANKSVGLHPSKLSTVTVGRHAANIIGKDVNEVSGDLKPKRLKSKAGSDHYDPSNGDHRPTDRLAISINRQTESTQFSMKSKLSDRKNSEKVEMYAKKRKMIDGQESLPYANASESRKESCDIIRRNEKRLKTANTEFKESTAIKGKTVKIILSGSKENSVDRSHEKKQQQDKHTENVTSRPNLNDSERFLLSATSSSSKVSDSCRRPNRQERKGSPVESVSSLPAAGKTISRKTGTEIPRKLLAMEDDKELHDIDASQRFCGKVDLKHKEALKIRNIHMINSDTVREGATNLSDCRMSMKDNSNGRKVSSFQRAKAKVSDPLPEQESFQNKMRRVEEDVANRSPAMYPDIVGDERQKRSNESGAKIIRRWTGDGIGDEKPLEEKLGDVGGLEVMTTVKKDMRNVSVVKYLNETDGSPCSAAKKSESALFHRPSSRSLEITNSEVSDRNVSKVLKHPKDVANQNVENLVTDCGNGTIKDLGVLSFVKEYASSQTAMTAFRRAEESKDYADRIKISGFDYECKDAYFDSALKFLYAASLLEACSTDFSKSKGVDPVNVYSTAGKLCKTCAQEYEKEKQMAAATLAYKCMEVVYMRIVYCKSLVTRQDLQTSFQMVNLGESPSSSASDVDNLNNQATLDKTMLSKSVAPPGNYAVARNQANFQRLLDFTSDTSLAMEASKKTQNAYTAASEIIEAAQNKEMIISVKRVVDFSFQDVKELVCLVQHAREAINRQGFRGNKE